MCRAVLVVLLASLGTATAQSLPLVDEVDWPSFRTQVVDLLAGLRKLDSPLPRTTETSLASLLAEKTPSSPRVAARAVQKLLDPHCLIGITINPESRVKAARGDRAASLTRDRTEIVLVRVHNEAGVTHPLMAASEQAIVADKKDSDRWLELNIVNEKPFENRLTGQRLEYRLLKLTARQTGKREATLSFDVGQGTQDLGFRSEVPILFSIRMR